MKRRIVPVVAALAALTADGASRAPFELVGEKSRATVVLAANAHESSRLAAAELTNYVHKATGAALAVTASGEARPARGGCVRIGTLDAFPGEVPAAARAYLASAKKGEAAWMGTDGGDLCIVGRREVAELYETYHFLEKMMGVFWFKAPIPEDPGEHVPRAKTLVFAPFAEGREPAFEIRRLGMVCARVWTPPVGQATAVRNGFQVWSYKLLECIDKPDSDIYRFYRPREWKGMISMGGGHPTFYDPIPAKRYFKEHPEYFALQDGKRVSGRQICISNPDVQRIVADSIVASYRRNGNMGEYLFGLLDVMHGWCECDVCRALDAPGEANARSATPNISTRFNKCAAKIMALVRERLPDADMHVWAYAAYRDLPVGVKHDPRVKVQFCDHGRCYGHTFDDPKCPRNRDLYRLLLGWLEVTPRVYTYEYFTCSDPFYVCHEGVEERDIKNYRRLGIVGWSNEASFTGSEWALPKYAGSELRLQTNWQWLWMTGKLLWDPKQDGTALIASAEAKYYGVAYPAMRKYHALRRKIWDASAVCMGYPAGDARRPTLLSLPGAKEDLLGFLDEADALAATADEVTRFRLRQDRRWLNEYWIKPNEELAAKISKAYHVNETATPPDIDGDGSDACWAGAQYLVDFRRPSGGKGGEAAPAALATQVGLLYDDANLYALIRAKEPKPDSVVSKRVGNDVPVWSGEDAVEIFLAPPSVDGSYYQVAVNLNGAVYDAANPGGRVSWNSGAVAKARRTPDGWTLEVKIPAKRLFDLRRGDVWKLMVARNRPRKGKAGLPDCFTLGGGEHHNTGTYLPIEIGAANLKNGSFEDLDEKGQPKHWSDLSKASKVLRNGVSNSVLLKHGSLFQSLWGGDLRQGPDPRDVTVRFRAKGPGVLEPFMLRYSDSYGKEGETKREFLPRHRFAPVETAGEMRLYQLDYRIEPNEWVAVGFYAGADAIEIDDVSVTRAASAEKEGNR